MTLPVVQGVGTGSETSCAWPTHTTGDLALLFVEHGGGTVTTPTGCTIIPGFPIVNGATSTMSGFYRFATSSSEAALALAGGTDHMWGTIITVRGANATDPFRVATMVQGGGAITGASFPGLLTTSADNLIIQAMAINIDNAGPLASAEANAALGSVTEQYDAGTVTGNGGSLVIMSGTLAVAGATGNSTLTLSTGSQWIAATLAIRPAAGTPAFTVEGTVTINGVAAADGVTVEIWDETLGTKETSTTTSGGAGHFSVSVLFNSASRYRAVFDDGTHRGCSALGTAA